MTRIVTTHYRYKRPPRKRKAVALEMPAIVAIPDKKRRRVSMRNDTSDAAKATAIEAPAIVTAASKPDIASSRIEGPPANEARKSAIVTVRRKGRADVPDLTLEESNRRADLADAMFQDMKRRIAEKDRS